MKLDARSCVAALWVGLGAAACATPPPVEPAPPAPPAPESSTPPAAADPAPPAAPPPAATAPVPEATPGVPGPRPVTASNGKAWIHLEGAWFPVRGERLGLDLESAQARDRSFAIAPPADGLWWDEQLAQEVWGLWTELCRECHEGKRALGKVLKMPPPGRQWAFKDAKFFTRVGPPRSVFEIVKSGAKAKAGEKDMPAWAGKLTNEQMWGLVYMIGVVSQKKNDLR